MSDEFVASLDNDTFIRNAFRALLRRTPTDAELADWRHGLHIGKPRSEMLASVVASQEFQVILEAVPDNTAINRERRATVNPHYPAGVFASAVNQTTVSAIERFGCSSVAEFGILDGNTTLAIARLLAERGSVSIFDFQHNVDMVLARAEAAGLTNLVGYGNSTKLLDSYNWTLARILEKPKSERPSFDYVFIDGAHTWNVDALTFFLADQLLTVGGYIDLDDYGWSIARSPTLAPHVFPPTVDMYTPEQIADEQITRLVETLVKPHPRYREVEPNKIYQKTAE
jgi:predicted O-methyltransferase YrrM